MQPFIGTNDLSDLLGTDVSGEDLATIAIDSACEAVRSYIDNQVNLLEETITLDGTGTYRLLLPRPPVRSVSDVTEDDEVLTEETDWTLEAGGVLRRIGARWSAASLGNIELTYEHGWDIEEPTDPEYTPVGFERVPSDMRRVALELAKRMYQQAAVLAGVTSEKIGNYSYTMDTAVSSQGVGFLHHEMLLLSRYMRAAP